MDIITNEFTFGPLVGQRRTDYARVPVMQGRHSVIKVSYVVRRDMGRRLFHLFVRRPAVPDRNDDTRLATSGEKSGIFNRFRRNRNNFHNIFIRSEPGKIGFFNILRRLRAFIFRIDKRPFHMGA